MLFRLNILVTFSLALFLSTPAQSEMLTLLCKYSWYQDDNGIIREEHRFKTEVTIDSINKRYFCFNDCDFFTLGVYDSDRFTNWYDLHHVSEDYYVIHRNGGSLPNGGGGYDSFSVHLSINRFNGEMNFYAKSKSTTSGLRVLDESQEKLKRGKCYKIKTRTPPTALF